MFGTFFHKNPCDFFKSGSKFRMVTLILRIVHDLKGGGLANNSEYDKTKMTFSWR